MRVWTYREWDGVSQLLSNSSGVARNTRRWLGGICVLRGMNIIRNVLSVADIPV